MPITLKKDEWKVKDPSSGNYRGAAILSTTLPEDAAQIIEDTESALDAEEVRAGQIISDAQNSVDGIEAQSSLIQQKVANAVLNGNNYELIDSAVESWLDAHPEATTTVEDASLTEVKFTDSLKLKTIKDYVTPEMFGAIGDGITDDTEAIQNAVQSGYNVYFKNNYSITSTIFIQNSCSLFGEGTIFMEGSNSTKSIFYCSNNQIDLEINGLTFKSNRDYTPIIPEGHTRPGPSYNSNVIAIFITPCHNLTIYNCTFDEIEYCIKTSRPSSELDNENYLSANIIIVEHCRCINQSMPFYFSYTNYIYVNDCYIELYEKIGGGEHAYYICDKNRKVIINNQYICLSDNALAGGYACHVYSSDANYTETVICNNWIIKSKQLNLCAAYSKNIVLMNNIDFIGGLILVNNYAGDCKINNLKVHKLNPSQSISSYQDCKLIINNSEINSRLNVSGDIILNNCIVNTSDITEFCIYNYAISTNEIHFYKNCVFIANFSDGILSFRNRNSENSFTIINCILINKKDNYIFYNPNNDAPIYLYNNYSNCKNIARDIETEHIISDNNFLNLNYNI